MIKEISMKTLVSRCEKCGRMIPLPGVWVVVVSRDDGEIEFSLTSEYQSALVQFTQQLGDGDQVFLMRHLFHETVEGESVCHVHLWTWDGFVVEYWGKQRVVRNSLAGTGCIQYSLKIQEWLVEQLEQGLIAEV